MVRVAAAGRDVRADVAPGPRPTGEAEDDDDPADGPGIEPERRRRAGEEGIRRRGRTDAVLGGLGEDRGLERPDRPPPEPVAGQKPAARLRGTDERPHVEDGPDAGEHAG